MLKIRFKKNFLFLLFIFLIPSNALAENLMIQSFGHGSFLIKGKGRSIHLNPFKSVGCTKNLEEPKNIKRDFILASSRLADEGYNPNQDLMFVDPGVYKIDNTIITGLSVPHDRFNGRRFGMATVWTWTQNDFKIVHMGGAAGEITIKDKIILANPDILFISIGGGSKSYDGLEASNIVNLLNPKIVIPVHYIRNKKIIKECDLSNPDLFIQNLKNFKVKNIGKNIDFNSKKINSNTIYLFKN